MSVVVAAVVGVVAGAALVVALAFLPPEGWGWVNRRRTPTDTATPEGAGAPPPAGTFRALAVLDELPTATVVLDENDEVLFGNGAAVAIGVIHGNRLAISELRDLIRATRRDGRVREAEVDLPPAELGRRPLAVRARVVSAGGRDVAVIVDDLTETRRVEAVRRDFVANVSHELKTPVGAIALLAEAAEDAHDDPEAVRHFVERMQHESRRLGRLVQELIDLSRLQGGEPLPDAAPVSLGSVVREVIDRVRSAAESKHITIGYDESDALVVGSEPLLVTAVGNLVDNAVAYSDEGARVAVGIRNDGPAAELVVTDEGIGIAADDLERIFERFYRVDPARSRSTGGTGLGLAIVKHIVTNHGGTISVWSTPGEGSTFTVRLPVAATDRPLGAKRPAPAEVEA